MLYSTDTDFARFPDLRWSTPAASGDWLRDARTEASQTTHQAMKEFDLVFLWVARSLEGLFRLAGEEELADRIRTSVGRVTRRQADQSPE